MILSEELNEPLVLNPLQSSQLDVSNYKFVYMARASLRYRGKAEGSSTCSNSERCLDRTCTTLMRIPVSIYCLPKDIFAMLLILKHLKLY